MDRPVIVTNYILFIYFSVHTSNFPNTVNNKGMAAIFMFKKIT